MKIRKIARLCKKRKTIALFEDTEEHGGLLSGEQWLSDGRGIYSMRGMPRMDSGNVASVLDVPEDKREGYSISHTELPTVYSFADLEGGDKPVKECGVGLSWKGQALRPYLTSGGLVFLDEELLSPLDDLDRTILYERKTPGGQIYFAAHDGFFLVALLLPEELDGEKLLGELVTLESELSISLGV